MSNALQIATLMTALATPITVLVMATQLYLNRKDEQVSRLYYLHNYLVGSQFGHARYHVRHELVNKPYEDWSPEDHAQANLVCGSYDQAGILFSLGLVSPKLRRSFLSSSWGESVCDQYEILGPFLKDQQTPCKTGEEFFEHFRRLHDEAAEIRSCSLT